MRRDRRPETKVVAVTGLHRGDSPQPGASVITSLRRRFPTLRVIGLSYDPMESAIYSRASDRVDAAYLIPYPRAAAAALLKRLDAILAKEHIDFIIPCLDSEIPNFIEIESALAKRGVRCVLPTARAFARRSKENLYAFCRRRGIAAPITHAADNVEALARFAERIGYPVYVKGRFYEAHLVGTRFELAAAFDELMRDWGAPVLVQEIILGEEYDVVGLGDGKGGLLGHCPIRKMLRTSAGKGFAGVVVADPRLDELTRQIVHALRWNGPFELEFIKPPGKPHALFEMNPRFPAWVDFPSQIGMNLPLRLFERLLGLPGTPLKTCAAGQMFIRHSIDLCGDIADLAKMASAGERIDSRSVKEDREVSPWTEATSRP